jgi:NADPH-dependent 2,4-dienoyl-CoA reductase/sulfur reductase-like enzyme
MALNRRDLLLGSAGMAAGLAASRASGSTSAQAQQSSPTKWDRDADVVVIGSGATGLPAAIVAQEAGSSVILVEAEKDIMFRSAVAPAFRRNTELWIRRICYSGT